MAATTSSSNGAMPFAVASAGLDILSGVFGYLASGEMAAMAESRGRMIRLEAEAEAQQYAEQARGFKASQKLAYLKSGVTLSGSPLDILAETVRVAQEHISAIRARGAAGQLDEEGRASEARAAGNVALARGISGGLGKIAWASYMGRKADNTRTENRKNTPGTYGGYSYLQPSRQTSLGY